MAVLIFWMESKRCTVMRNDLMRKKTVRGEQFFKYGDNYYQGRIIAENGEYCIS